MRRAVLLLLLATCSNGPRQFTACGDGIIEPGETCDDGNRTAGDGCSEFCQIEGVCGDDRVEPGETCDPPDGVTCGPDCQNLPENCSDGIDNDGDGLVDCADPDCRCADAGVPDAGVPDAAPPDASAPDAAHPGTTPLGGPCTSASECDADQPLCLGGGFKVPFAGGDCAAWCELAAPACPAGSSCVDLQLDPTQGACLATCDGDGDCRTGYSCVVATSNGDRACLPR